LRRFKIYTHEEDDWPNFYWEVQLVNQLMGEARNQQRRLLGKMESLGFDSGNITFLNTLILDVLKSSEIEGEHLAEDQVRSSIARKLGMDVGGTIPSERNVDGVVEMILDATQNYQMALTAERFFGWHAALFPTSRSGICKIVVGNWREDTTGPMQIVSGALGKQKVHFEAPDSKLIKKEMKFFLKWLNEEDKLDTVLKAAVVRLWLVTIHPFDDGNGKITRAVTDMLLARSDKTSQRFYSLSNQIQNERKAYYAILEKTQQGNLDITEWIVWFFNCFSASIVTANKLLKEVLFKADFWKTHSGKILNERQHFMLNKLLDGFIGKLTSTKWGKICKCSADSPLRDINDLIKKNFLIKLASGGRSTNYVLKDV